MLAHNFKTAADLRIRDDERDALITVLGMLERGELIYSPRKKKIPYGFNMDCTIFGEPECGTVACIGGWVAILTKRDASYVGKSSGAIRDLYWPVECQKNWESIPPAAAAMALRNYLTLGDPRWSEVPV